MFQLLLLIATLSILLPLVVAQTANPRLLQGRSDLVTAQSYFMTASGGTSVVIASTSSLSSPPLIQQFYFDSQGRMLVYIDATNVRCVTDMGASNTIAATNVQLQVCSTAVNQQWYWDSLNRIRSKNNPLRCLDLAATNPAANVAVNTYGCSDTSLNQQWSRLFGTCNPGSEPNTAVDGCQNCILGETYKNIQGFTKCVQCPSSSSCAIDMFLCKAGFQRSADLLSCIECTGSYKPAAGNTECIPCPGGATCTSTAFQCNPGRGVNSLNNGCLTCGGSKPYKPFLSNDQCQSCPSGATCDSTAATTFSCNSGYQVNPTKTGCDQCLAPDWYNPISGNSTCIKCPNNAECLSPQFRCSAGFELINGVCSKCSEGWMKSSAGNQTCTQCNAGTESYVDRTSCLNCQTGYYRPTTVGMSKCIKCPNNSTCDNFGFWCDPGFTLNAAGNGCDRCAQGTVKNWEGNEVCEICPIGFESNAAMTDCQLCSDGTAYRPSLSVSKCLPCPANSVCDFTSFTCNAGYRINDTLAGCFQCPIATEVSADKRNCTTCQPGFFRPSITTPTCQACPSNSACYPDDFDCDYGYIYNSETKQCVLTFCKQGYYLGTDPKTRVSACIECPYHSNCGAKTFQCHEGYGFRADNCTECPNGQFKTGNGNWGCLPCVTLGKEAAADHSKCIDCKPGFFKPSSDFDFCIPCPDKARCSTSEYFCAPGFTKDLNATFACAQCPVSTFKSDEGTQECTPCPAGAYSNSDYTLCTQCPPGSIKTQNQTCFQCPEGTEPTVSKAACQPCKEGAYRSILTTSICAKCPTGSICTTKGFKCPQGFAYQRENNACVSSSLNFSENPGAVTGVTFGVIAVLGLAVFAFVRLRHISDSDGSGSSTFGTYSRPGLTSSTTGLTKSGSNNNVYSLNNLSQSKPTLQSPAKSRSGSTNQLSGSVDSFVMPPPPYQTDGRNGSWKTATLSLKDSSPANPQRAHDAWADDAISGSSMNTQEVGLPEKLKFTPNVDFGPDKILQQEDIYTVFLGKSTNQALTLVNGNQVVIKEVIKQENRPDVEAFFAEVRTMVALKDHANITKISGYAVDPYCLLMKHYPLGSLDTWLSSSKFIKRKAIIVSFAKDTVSALSHVHRNGYAHCAIRPSNLVMELNSSGKLICLLTGFASAQRYQQSQQQGSMPSMGRNSGSTIQRLPQRQALLKYSVMAYASPEIISSAKIPTPRRLDLFKADIYSLAVLVEHMTTRRAPWSK